MTVIFFRCMMLLWETNFEDSLDEIQARTWNLCLIQHQHRKPYFLNFIAIYTFLLIKLQVMRCNFYTIGELHGSRVLSVIVNICLYPFDVFAIFVLCKQFESHAMCFRSQACGIIPHCQKPTPNRLRLMTRDNVQSQNGLSQQYQSIWW